MPTPRPLTKRYRGICYEGERMDHGEPELEVISIVSSTADGKRRVTKRRHYGITFTNCRAAGGSAGPLWGD